MQEDDQLGDELVDLPKNSGVKTFFDANQLTDFWICQIIACPGLLRVALHEMVAFTKNISLRAGLFCLVNIEKKAKK